MPVMTMHDVRKDKTYSSEKWLTLEELAKEAWVDYPKEPSFGSAEAVQKPKRGRPKKEETLDNTEETNA